jgi:glycine oxidase
MLLDQPPLSPKTPPDETRQHTGSVLVIGAGVAGLTVAHALAARGADVTVAEIRDGLPGSASWFAGGMLAPWCERESAEEAVLTLGKRAADWWDQAVPGEVQRRGTIVLARPRDASELGRFASRTTNHVPVGADEIARLEPDLAAHFRRGLYFAEEAHLDPRRTLIKLQQRLAAAGVTFRFSTDGRALAGYDHVVDCSGLGDHRPGLRGVRGEMLILSAPDVSLSRPVRLLHPRFPLYIVPRDNHRFMVGATMIETIDDRPITARSAMELLNAAYSLHPAFAEASIVEMGVGVRPSYADNMPRVEQDGRTISVNGLYRHGFLLAPAMAEEVAELIFEETKD